MYIIEFCIAVCFQRVHIRNVLKYIWACMNENSMDANINSLGASINYVDKQGEGGGLPNVNDTT